MFPNSDKNSSVLPYLTKATHISAPFIATFLLIHLTAPALANVGGSTLSSQTMVCEWIDSKKIHHTHTKKNLFHLANLLFYNIIIQSKLLGREYYQSQFGEKFLVLTPITVHAISAIAKRLLSPKSTTRPPLRRPLSNLLSITGYASALFFLPIHYITHRVHPTIENAPIFAVGPSELDYEFVKTGLHVWPWRSWFLYTGLIVTTSLHLADGMTIIWNTWLKDIVVFGAWKPSHRNRRLSLAFAGIALPVLAGLYTLSREPLMAFASTLNRYQTSFISSFIYRIQF